jgi:pre-mRNA-splicing factor SYF1
MHQPSRLTLARRTFDRALKALPVTQHKLIWDLYLAFANRAGGDTTIRVWRRFLKIQPTHAERYCNTLLELEPPRTAEAARILTAIIETPEKYSNPNGKTVYQYWALLCQLIMEHPEGIEMPQQDHLVPTGEMASLRPDKLDVELILRTGIKRFTDQVGMLWNSLARWWILQGEFERARDVFEEGIRTVTTVKDFTMIFDAYAKMEESVLSDAMGKPDSELDDTDIDLRLERFERLMNRRPFLVSDVILRQNPHNIQEWKNRIQLYVNLNNIPKVIETYQNATKAVNPHRCSGNPTDLWLEFAKFYEDREQIDDARTVFEQAVKCNFKNVDDLASVWCQWAEMEIRQGEFNDAIQVLGRATAPMSGNLNIRYNDDTKSTQQRLFKSIKLWSFYADLEESVGNVDSTKAVYNRILELKIATPQVIINYASFLEENQYFEESFRVYQRGVELFGYPVAFEIWNLYLSKFIKRYEGTKLERARDLFEQALDNCPTKYCKDIYLLYAKVEEDYGLARHALKIYDRATKAVEKKDLYEMFNIYIAKAASFFGIIATRDIYTKALEVLPDKQARNMAVKFCEMETKLGEVDRARAILAYGSQLSDPRVDPEYWKIWHDFETKYGNEDTFKEMLRYDLVYVG